MTPVATSGDAYRDSSGRRLADYPRPSVAVDSAVLTVPIQARSLHVVLADSEGALRLPGTFLHEGEVLADAARRSLREKAGIEGIEPQQLHVFDALGRDDRGWVLSVAHLAVVHAERLPTMAHLVPVDEVVDTKYDHAEIVRLAVERIRTAYAAAPDPSALLTEPFTLRDLQRLHEAVAGRELRKDTFRRGMEPRLVPTGEQTRGGMGKPARLWRRA